MMEKMELGNMNVNSLQTFEAEGKTNNSHKVSVSALINSTLQQPDIKSDSFSLDMERFSHLTLNDFTPNSRITLQRNHSRKGQPKEAEKKMNTAAADKEIDANIFVPSSLSPIARGASTPEKPLLVTAGATNHPNSQQIHHQITITTPITTATATESKLGGKRTSFRRSTSTWTIDPRRIFFFFATLSSMGTVLLIYFTISMREFGEDVNFFD